MSRSEASPWVKTTEAARHLSLSRRTLQRYIDLGWLDAGSHYLRVPAPSSNGSNCRSHFLWNLPAIELKLADLTRQAAASSAEQSPQSED